MLDYFRLLSLNLTITSLTVSLGGMGAITTCFGMNLVTGLEESASAFPMVCAASAGTALLMFLGIRAAVLGDSGRMAESKKLRTRKTFEHAFADLQSLEIAIDAATRAVIERSSMSGGISSINNDLKSDPNQATSSSNSSTQLTMEEFGKILAEVKGVKELPRDEVECVFALVDSNYDGVLSLQESLELRQSFNRLKGSPEM